MKLNFVKFVLTLFLFFLFFSFTIAQNQQDSLEIDIELINEKLDSLYIVEFEEDKKGPAKVLHAEPLFIDLIRDLGARKGEKEWNVGFGLTDKNNADLYSFLIEYEWAPIDRLGLEVELPFSFYYTPQRNGEGRKHKLNSLKAATQYTFFVSDPNNISMAMGYLHEFELIDFSKYGKRNIYSGNIFNPFFVAAKRWGQNFHTLIYTGPYVTKMFNLPTFTEWHLNTSFNYMISGTRNFLGIELNKELTKNGFDMVMRPQMRLGIADNFMIGIVTGVPINRSTERLSNFIRIIYEPGHRQIGIIN
ncbi:MAG: HAEPLYID family protein [Bacteroidia bacterium]